MDKPLLVADDILPFADFKAHASEIVRGLRDRGRPVVITHNGRPSAVLLSPEAYDKLAYQARFLGAVAEGLGDAEAGRVVDEADLDDALDEREP